MKRPHQNPLMFYLAFFVMLLLLGALTLIVRDSLKSTKQAYRDLTTVTLVKSFALAEMQNSQADVQTQIAKLLSSEGSLARTSFLAKKIHKDFQAHEKSFRDYMFLAIRGHDDLLLEKYGDKFHKFTNETEKIIDVYKSGEKQIFDMQAKALDARYELSRDEMLSSLEELASFHKADLEKRAEDIENLSARSSFLLIIIAVILIGSLGAAVVCRFFYGSSYLPSQSVEALSA